MKRWAIYIVVVLAAILGAGYVFSPSGYVRDQIAAAVSEGNANAVFSCSSSRATFPPGIRLEQIAIGFRNRGDAKIEAQSLIVKPRLIDLLLGRLSYTLRSELYGGRLTGAIDYIRYFSLSGPLKAIFKGEDIDLEKCSYLSSVNGRPFKGKLNGSMHFEGAAPDLIGGSGNAQIAVRGGNIQLIKNISGYGIMDCDKLDAEITFDRGDFKFEQLLLTGRSVRVTLKGHVFLKEDTSSSELLMSGFLEMLPDDTNAGPNARIRLTVTGTVSSPTVSVM